MPQYLCKKKMIFFEGFSVPNSIEIRVQLHQLAERQNFSIHKLSYTFLDQAAMLSLNQSALDHDTHTDIITFDYSKASAIEADIYISLSALEHNAETYQVSFQQELCRILAHGLLHCIGFNDKTEQEKLLMRAEEDRFLECFTWNN